ncbi:MAG: glycosyltransferase [bacterium]|nr:glycosyltransferase [bacterium]MCM1374933.1 glycosyltransferase [Muribaculum sp.]
MQLGIKAKLRNLREKQLNRQYVGRLARAKRQISYEDWLRLVACQQPQIGLSYRTGIITDVLNVANRNETQQGFAMLKEQGISLILQSGGYVDPMAFAWIADYFREHPQAQLLYGDEDVLSLTGKHRNSPCFKPDWSPDTWLSCFYLGSVIALRRELAAPFQELWTQSDEDVLCFERPEQVRLLVHQLLRRAGGFERDCDTVAHLRGMLFHMSYDAAQNGRQKAYWQEDGFGRSGELLRNAVSGDSRPVTISVVIPSRDNPDVLEQCLNSLRKCQENIGSTENAVGNMEEESPKQRYQMEFLVIDNGSTPENRQKIQKITCGMKYIYEQMPFNFSRMCNRGAQEASGEILLFLNDDITVCADGWLEAMADRALRPYVGAVGLKLYYPDCTTIQHAGIANLPGGPVHKLQFTVDGQEEDCGYGSLDRNVIAVTGACLMVLRDRFLQAGGFPEDLQVAYNDVELCLRLREAGWHNMVVNSFHAYHHESLSRGSDLTREKMMRLRQERETLYRRHPQYVGFDPYYWDPLCTELGNTHVFAQYLDIRTELQSALPRRRRLARYPEREPEKLVFTMKLYPELEHRPPSGYDMGDRWYCLRGYLVVKWENNACYKRYLLLRAQKQANEVYIIHLRAGYSREAEYGAQEQPNVAMCGFVLTLPHGCLPDGLYQIGIQARSRVGRRSLTAWTEHWLQIRNGMPVPGDNKLIQESV